MPRRIDEYLDLVAGNSVWRDRYRGIGTITRRDGDRDGPAGPNLRATGVPYDLRRAEPYLAYDQLEFERHHGRARRRAFDRLMCRTKEMYESVKLDRAVPRQRCPPGR